MFDKGSYPILAWIARGSFNNMSVSASTQIPKTSDSAVFQRQCKVLFECILNDPHVEDFGTTGQGQKGIDLLGRRRNLALDHWVGVQCKLTIKSPKLKAGQQGVVEIEATRALTFEPALKELIIATTAPNDTVLQREAAVFTDRQAKLGRDFTVQVWGWETLTAHILRYEAALKAFMPDAFPQIDRIIQGQEKLSEEIEGLVSMQGSFASTVLETLVRVEQQTASFVPLPVLDDRSLDTLIDRQIDRLRDMLTGGKPRTALGLLETLWTDLPKSVESRIRFRVKANIAACLLRIGEERKAAESYLDAYQYAPADPKAVAFKVLAYLLLKQPQDALDFGLRAFDGGPEQGPLVAYMITAAKLLPNADDPLGFISEAVADKPEVAVAKVDYLRSKGQPSAWWEVAVEYHGRHPDDENLARAAAEADIDRASQWVEVNDHRPLDDALRNRVTEAVSRLEQLRAKYANSEVAWDDDRTSLCINLAVGQRLLRQYEEAKDTIEAALLEAPDDLVLKHALLTTSLEAGDFYSAERALQSLPETRDVIMARLQLAANGGHWQAVVDIHSNCDLSILDNEDRAVLDALMLIAKARLGDISDARGAATSLLQKHPTEPAVPTILYQLALYERNSPWANELFLDAFAKVDSGSYATRIMLAQVAEREDDPEKVIELLHGRIEVTRDSQELQSLARAFVNSPVRQTAISFIESLPPDVCEKPFYARAIASIHFNRGDLAAAATFFQKALDGNDVDVAAHLGLINTWLRQNNRELVGPHLDTVDLMKLEGPPSYKMHIAQLLVAFERADRGLSFGYDVAVSNRSDQRTVMGYIGLILPDPTAALIPSVGSKIAPDCWVKAQRSDGRVLIFVIDRDTHRNDPDHLNPDHPFARLFLNQEKGATVVSIPVIGTEERWEVVEFKHKYLALLHEFIELLPSRFPDAKGFYRFEFKQSDPSGFLAEVKRIGEQDEQIFKHYIDDGFPLALVASLRGRSTVEFAGHVISRGHVIRTCLGNDEERKAAFKLILAFRPRGVVLDTYSAWVAQQLGLLPILKKLFRKVALPRSSIDELNEWRERIQPKTDEPLLTIGYADGQHIKEEISAERLREGAERIVRAIEEISREFQIVPAAAPSAPSDAEQKLLDIGRHGFLDPMYVSVSEDLLLVSDDLPYRLLTWELHGREGVWLQAILLVALCARLLDANAYAEAVYGLAAQKHSHVTLNAQILLRIALTDPSENLPKLAAAAEFIGNESADLESHLSVAWDFINEFWNTDLSYLRRARATGIMLERLVPLLARFGLVEKCYSDMIRASQRRPLLQEYLASWARGHFLDLNEEQ